MSYRKSLFCQGKLYCSEMSILRCKPVSDVCIKRNYTHSVKLIPSISYDTRTALYCVRLNLYRSYHIWQNYNRFLVSKNVPTDSRYRISSLLVWICKPDSSVMLSIPVFALYTPFWGVRTTNESQNTSRHAIAVPEAFWEVFSAA